MWVVKGRQAPGRMGFYKGAVEKGWIFSDPRAANARPGRRAMSEITERLAATGGVPYETDMTIKLDGDGPMAAIMAKMGGVTATSTVQSVEAGSLSDDSVCTAGRIQAESEEIVRPARVLASRHSETPSIAALASDGLLPRRRWRPRRRKLPSVHMHLARDHRIAVPGLRHGPRVPRARPRRLCGRVALQPE